MQVTLYTPQNKLFEKIEAKSVCIPGTAGDMQILNNHISVITTLRPGNLVVEKTNGERIVVQANQGYVQFADNNMTIVIEKTNLSDSELSDLAAKAEKMKDVEIKREEEVTEEEFEETREGQTS